MKRRVLIVYTGGTIGMRLDPQRGVLIPFDVTSIYDQIPTLRDMVEIEIEVQSMPNIVDSSNATPSMWVELGEMIVAAYDSFDGFVVLHGTDTMSYAASALSFMLENLDKPVIFTGSQIPIGVMRSDGREHLITAIEMAAAHIEGTPRIREVALYFKNKLFRANRTTKRSSESLTAFDSYNFAPLAEVGVNIHYADIAHPVRSGTLRLERNMSAEVIAVRLFPGLSCKMLRGMLSMEGLRGVVLETYGAGNAPSSEEFLAVISDAIARGIVILNVTQCLDGIVEMSLYETGMRLLDVGVLSGRDMTTEAALVKLIYLLSSGKYQKDELAKLLKNPIRGEFTC